MARWNLKGWNFTEWFLGNGKTIKEILKVAVPAIIAYLATSSPAWTVFATLVGKLVLDTAEYYIKE